MAAFALEDCMSGWCGVDILSIRPEDLCFVRPKTLAAFEDADESLRVGNLLVVSYLNATSSNDLTELSEMVNWVDIIEYRDFYDVPRVFLVEFEGSVYLFDSPFEDSIDDYGERYAVYEIAANIVENLPRDWTDISRQAVSCCGTVSIDDVTFDSGKRQRIESSIFGSLSG